MTAENTTNEQQQPHNNEQQARGFEQQAPTIRIDLEKETALQRTPRVVAIVHGKLDKPTKLDFASDVAVSRYANRLAMQFEIEVNIIRSEISRVATQHADLLAKNRGRHRQLLAEAPRVLDYVSKAMLDLDPLRINRQKKTIYFAGREGAEIKRSVPFGDVLALLAKDVGFVDGIANTREGLEAMGESGRSVGWEASLRILRCTMPAAIAKVVEALPDEHEGDSEDEVRRQECIKKAVAFLLQQRTYRAEHGEVVSNTFFNWASRLPVDSKWRPFHIFQFFARREVKNHPVWMAVNANYAADSMRYVSGKQFIREMSDAGLGKHGAIKIKGSTRRVFIFSRAVIDEIAIHEPGTNAVATDAEDDEEDDDESDD